MLEGFVPQITSGRDGPSRHWEWCHLLGPCKGGAVALVEMANVKVAESAGDVVEFRSNLDAYKDF